MINNYRFGAYAILAMGLINLRYQTGNTNNLNNSSVLIAIGVLGLAITLINPLRKFLDKKASKIASIIVLIGAIAYGFIL